ncbi:stalk domain-containing protein [Cohnella luojiensis]|uniref:Copper amine oxidase N-terminal domain-containing protein n=1 Tax=Cohnella luojiensis TaxID=652876 RepID=A0A4Y8LY60_9BACL|nr:stalk domain-containing protein [Cohnella luojiensis]TFE24851.1 copper amine oxidase N-terminal domain-containing protein [Cohnella luojiensis]
MKRSFMQLFVVVMLLCSIPIPAIAEGSANGLETLTLIQNSKKMIHNGSTIMATQPLTAIKGVSYVAAKSLMKEIYGVISYDSKSKKYTLSNGLTNLSIKVGSTVYSVNGGSEVKGVGAPYVLKGSLMIPLKTVSVSFGMTLMSIPKEKKVVMTWESKPVAKFTVSNVNPYAQQTEVSYTDLSYHPRGLAIVDERWEFNETIFEQAGTYEVSHWVMDETGFWSDAYTVIVTVKPPNQPPVAMFATDKDTYKMGEFIQYTDQSTDDENRIVSRIWSNGAKGFFEPGPQTITLKVTDANGAVNEYSKTITIENETKYSKEEFYLVYTDVGEKFPISGPDVLNLPIMSYDINPQPQTLIRSNSPETIVDEGIYYEDHVTGNVRFLLHNRNGRSTAVKIYIVATNNNNGIANVRIGPLGAGGPNSCVSCVGRAATGRYLESRLNPSYSNVQIPAGQSRILISDYSNKVVKPGDIYSMFADVTMDKQLKVQVVVVSAARDVLSYLPNLSILPSHDRHIRGTFEDANRVMFVNQTIGDVKSRMILADNVVDTRLPGVDKTTNTPVLNSGNYGTLYTIRINNVQPHTAIVVNPRGGHYAGAFSINNRVIYMTNTGILSNPNEVGMLYKTGDSVESVTIMFTPASGSMLPINLLFMPMPLES